jgi:hypothetical protein
MRQFDYIYYRIASLYIDTFNDKRGVALGALFVALCQLFIIGSVITLIAILSRDFNSIVFDRFLSSSNHKLWTWLIAVSILGFNFHRYFVKLNYEYLKTKWILEDSMSKHQNGLIITWFSILIFILMVVLAILRKYSYK